jgi:UDP-glucose 4-epimerase
MKILVTGSSGTIGTRLCERLLAEGHDVHGIDWVKNKWQPSIDALTTIVDMRDSAALAKVKLPWTPDTVVHLAANARVYELVEHPERAHDNLRTLFNALEFARAQKIKGFVFASSREVYGNAKQERYREDMVAVEHCESPYTASKLAGEAMVHAYRRCYNMQTVIVRFSNVYGMYDDSIRVVPLFLREAKAGNPLQIFGKDKCLDFTYIDDAVHGVMRILGTIATINGETINLATGTASTIVALAEEIIRLLKSASTITVKESRTGEVIRYTADITKARTLLGYEPKTSFKDGVAKAVAWYSANGLC